MTSLAAVLAAHERTLTGSAGPPYRAPVVDFRKLPLKRQIMVPYLFGFQAGCWHIYGAPMRVVRLLYDGNEIEVPVAFA